MDIDAAPPRGRDYKLADSGGLDLFVTKAGAKSWRWKFRFEGKERRLTFGLYPWIGIERARELRDQARVLLRAKRDPRQAVAVASQRDAAAFLLKAPDDAAETCVYFVRAPSGAIKIGVSRNVAKRLAQLQLGFDQPLTLMGTISGGYTAEGVLHRRFAESAAGGEWFSPSLRLLEFIDENVDLAACP